MTELIDGRNTFQAFKGFPRRTERDVENEERLASVPGDETPPEPEIDLPVLARKVYLLFKQELTLEGERLIHPGRRFQ